MASVVERAATPRRDRRRSLSGGRSALALILAFGMAGTIVFAVFEQRNAVQQQRLLFDRQAAAIAEEVRQDAQIRVVELETAANFVREASPVSQEVYEGFLEAEQQRSGDPTDPGVILLEVIRRSDRDAVVAAERASGNDDFEIVTFATNPDAEMLVVTRSVLDTQVSGIRIRGLDAAPFRTDMLGPGDLPAFGTTVNWIEPVELVSSVSGLDADQVQANDSDVTDVTAVLIRPVRDGSSDGWVVRFINSQRLLGGALERVPDDVNVRLTVDHIDASVAETRSLADLEPDDAHLRAEEFIGFATAGWTVEVWADEGYGVATGLFDQSTPWLFGVSLTLIAAILDVLIRRNRRRLSTAEFELDHARTLASTDPLTGLLNRQGLIDSSRIVADTVPATLYFVDLDGFKQVNDADGHDAGDRLLQDVAMQISSLFRADDVVSRLGGDEFVIFVPGSSDPALRRSVSERVVEAVSSVDDRVTCSVGLAVRASEESLDVKTMLRTADAAMYEAKRAGGNRFVHA